MLFVFFVCILSLASTVYCAPAKDNAISSSCNANIDRYSPCTATVSFGDWCTSAVLNFTNTPSAQCLGINFVWSVPVNNLTMILETSYTKTRQAYKIAFVNSALMEVITNVYQIINNKEIDVTSHDNTLILNSDSNYQVIVKFQAPSKHGRSIVFIRYDVTKS
jgi:hypothetical protein